MGNAAAKLSADQAKLAADKIALGQDGAAVSADQAERNRLAEAVKQASQISIPKGTSIEEAHRILDGKKKKVQDSTTALVASIQGEGSPCQEECDAGRCPETRG